MNDDNIKKVQQKDDTITRSLEEYQKSPKGWNPFNKDDKSKKN